MPVEPRTSLVSRATACSMLRTSGASACASGRPSMERVRTKPMAPT